MLIINHIDDYTLQRFIIVNQLSNQTKISIVYDLISSILSGSKIYHDLSHNIIETLFDGLKQFQRCFSRIINYQDDARRVPQSISDT